MLAKDSIWRNREYLKFFSSFTIGNIGDWFDFFALQLIFAHYFNASPMALSMLMVVYMAPMALFGGFSGIVVDRLNKKHLLVLTDFFSGILTVGLVLSGNLWWSLVLVFMRSTLGSLNGPAQQAALKHIVTEDQLLAASSYTQLVFQLCRVTGPLLGAIIVAFYSPEWCLVINAVSFFVSAVILLFLKNIVNTDAVAEYAGHIWRQLLQAFHIIKNNTVLRLMTVVTLWAFVFLMMGFAQMVLLLKEIFPNDTSLLGELIGISGIGSLVTGGWLSQKKHLPGYAGYMGVGFTLMALNFIGMGVYQASWSVYPLYVLSFVDGLGFGLVMVIYSYVVKKETPNTHMGRVSGLSSMLQGIVFAIGSVLGGLIAHELGLRFMFVLGGLGFLVLVGFIYLKRQLLLNPLKN